MNVWTLSGPAHFLQRVERTLRDGTSVVVRFPIRAPSGFREQALSLLDGSWHCTVLRPVPAESPFESLRERFAPKLSRAWKPTLLDLCEHEEFHGRLLWLDGLNRLDEHDWKEWKNFLTAYAQASRSVREFERTLFVVVLEGTPPPDPPQDDVTLTTYDWRGVIDEMDLLCLAYDRLFSRGTGSTMRSLLATTVARVAAWDAEVAERLVDEGDEVILGPGSMLRSLAREKQWTSETSASWEFGTASGCGALHAALASLEAPPRELERRIWSAQTSVLFPVIDKWRREFVEEHLSLLASTLREEEKPSDPRELDVGDLTDRVYRLGLDPGGRQRVWEMNKWRNDLAHLKPLSANAAGLLARR